MSTTRNLTKKVINIYFNNNFLVFQWWDADILLSTYMKAHRLVRQAEVDPGTADELTKSMWKPAVDSRAAHNYLV